MISIQERANNKIYSNIQMQCIELQDLKRELKSNRFKGNITIDEMENQNKDLFGQINHIKQDKLRIEHDLKLA